MTYSVRRIYLNLLILKPV
jgi:hypothetical protein